MIGLSRVILPALTVERRSKMTVIEQLEVALDVHSRANIYDVAISDKDIQGMKDYNIIHSALIMALVKITYYINIETKLKVMIRALHKIDEWLPKSELKVLSPTKSFIKKAHEEVR